MADTEHLNKPTLIYDGDCAFCLKWINRWRTLTKDKVAYKPFQEVASRFPQIPNDAFKTAVHLIEPDGRVSKGAEAVFRTLQYAPEKKWLAGAYDKIPLVAPATEWVYRRVANNRALISRLTRWL